jgi:hypothetical protein
MIDRRYLLLLIVALIAGQTIVPILEEINPLYNVALGWILILLVGWNEYLRFRDNKNK